MRILSSTLVRRIRRKWRTRNEYEKQSAIWWRIYDLILQSKLGKLPLPLRGGLRMIKPNGADSPLLLRLGTSDWNVLEEIFLENEYSAVMQLDPSNVLQIIDLGSNVGFSIRLWQCKFPLANITAVEPDADNASLLRKNVNNGLRPERVDIIEAGVSSDGRRLYLDRTKGAWGIRAQDIPIEGETSISTVSILNLLARTTQDIDLLKCDIEGGERELFAVSASWLHRCRNVIVELHAPYSQEDLSRDVERCKTKFEKRVLDHNAVVSLVLLKRRPDSEG